MSTYAKLHSTILDSSLWSATRADDDLDALLLDLATRTLMITLIAMADRDGIVESSLPGLARRAHLPPELTRRALAELMAPDPHSRTPDHEGRRVLQTTIDGSLAWRLVTYERHRDKKSPDDIRKKNAERQARYTQRKKERRAQIGPSAASALTSAPSAPSALTSAPSADVSADGASRSLTVRSEPASASESESAEGGAGGRNGKPDHTRELSALDVADTHHRELLTLGAKHEPDNEAQWSMLREQRSSAYRAVFTDERIDYATQIKSLLWALSGPGSDMWKNGQSWPQILAGRRPELKWRRHAVTIVDQCEQAPAKPPSEADRKALKTFEKIQDYRRSAPGIYLANLADDPQLQALERARLKAGGEPVTPPNNTG